VYLIDDSYGFDERLAIPAVSIPVVKKTASEFSCPSNHLIRMRDWLAEVTDVLAIGWHGAEKHFVDELANHLKAGAALTIVGRPDPDLDPDTRIEAVEASSIEWVHSSQRFASAAKFKTGFTRFVRFNLDEYVATLPS
jgi:hypothetical protein